MGMSASLHLSPEELEAAFAALPPSPADNGRLELIVRRPAEGEREVLDEGVLDLDEGLVGDRWRRGKPGKPARRDMQLNIMNARVIDLLAGSRDGWAIAGDQLYLDLDMSVEALPAGSRLALGSAVIEVTATPHTGCKKFAQRFGVDAVKFVNTPAGKAQRLRGMCALVAVPGTIRQGDAIRRL